MSDRRDVQVASSDFIIRDKSGRAMRHSRADAFLRGRATQLVPRIDILTLLLALDAEFQLIYNEETGTHMSVLGRISVVNYCSKRIYDVFVHFPYEEGKEMRLSPAKLKLGVYWKDVKLEFGAVPIEEVAEDLRRIFEGRILVGHAIHNDIAAIRGSGIGDVLEYTAGFRDTQKHEHYQKVLGQPQPGLKKLYRAMGGHEIQSLEHSSVEDAQATMELYRLRETEIEREQAAWTHWLEPPMSEEEMFEEAMFGPDFTYGPCRPKPVSQATKYKQEQEELDAIAKEYRAAQGTEAAVHSCSGLEVVQEGCSEGASDPSIDWKQDRDHR